MSVGRCTAFAGKVVKASLGESLHWHQEEWEKEIEPQHADLTER